MSLEIQDSDLRSRILYRIALPPGTTGVMPLTKNGHEIHFDVLEDEGLRLVEDGKEVKIFDSAKIRKEGFFSAHSVPHAVRWIRNDSPTSPLDFYLKRQIVYVAPEIEVIAKQETASLASENVNSI